MKTTTDADADAGDADADADAGDADADDDGGDVDDGDFFFLLMCIAKSPLPINTATINPAKSGD